MDFRPDEIEAQQRVQQKWHSMDGQGPWAVLGIRRGASDVEVKQAYFTLAREWHTDAFSHVRLGAAQEILDNVFAAIAEAYEILSDPNKKAEYEAALAYEAKGASTDLGELLEAEREFEKGKTLLSRGEVRGASKFFAQVAAVDPSNLHWKVHHLYADWWNTREKSKAPSIIGELEQIVKQTDGELVDGYYFAGRLAMEIEDYEKAGKYFKRVLRKQPGHTLTQRDNRTLMRKLEDAQKSQGFFARLFGKK